MLPVQAITEVALVRAERGFFTREQAALWAASRGASLDALLKRAVAKGEVWRIRRGLFCVSDRYLRERMNPLELAQLVHGPSYISMESALSYHGWIPEAVQAITSASQDRSRAFTCPLGLFRFIRVPQCRFFAGVRRIAQDGRGAFFLASPLKALADLVYAQRHTWDTAEPVVQSLRVEEEHLAGLTADQFDEVISAYRPGRVQRFLHGLRKDLNV